MPLFLRIGAADQASFYQLKTMLQGVVARGTARAMSSLSPYVAGKTGTTENSVDGWFVGFTNDVTIAVWVGYDNGDRKRRSLGPSEDGAKVALPIFQPIIESVWADNIAPREPLSGPSPEARGQLVDLPIDYMTGTPAQGGSRGDFIEHFRIGADGQVANTQYELVSQEEAEERRQEQTLWTNNEQNLGYGQQQGWSFPFGRSLFAPWGSNPTNSRNPNRSPKHVVYLRLGAIKAINARNRNSPILILSGADHASTEPFDRKTISHVHPARDRACGSDGLCRLRQRAAVPCRGRPLCTERECGAA